MENGHRGISDHVIAELCEIFACPPSEFFRLTDGDHIDMVDELLGEEVRKLTRAGKAALYAHAVALNSGENLRRRRDDS